MKLRTKFGLMLSAFMLLFQVVSVSTLSVLQFAGAPVVYADGASDVSFKPTLSDADSCEDPDLNEDNCKIIEYLLTFINGLSAIVAVTIVAVIVMAGIKFASAGDEPTIVSDAKNRIKNAIFALVAYIFMYAFLQWVVPGGIF